MGCDAGLMAAQKSLAIFSVVPPRLGTGHFLSQRGIFPLIFEGSLARQCNFRIKYRHHDDIKKLDVSAYDSGAAGRM